MDRFDLHFRDQRQQLNGSAGKTSNLAVPNRQQQKDTETNSSRDRWISSPLQSIGDEDASGEGREVKPRVRGASAASIDRIHTDLNARFPLPQGAGPRPNPGAGREYRRPEADHQIGDPRTHGRGRTSTKQGEHGPRALTCRWRRGRRRAAARGGGGGDAIGLLCAAMRDPASGADLCGRLTATWVRLAPRLPDGPRGPPFLCTVVLARLIPWRPKEIRRSSSSFRFDLLKRIIRGKL